MDDAELESLEQGMLSLLSELGLDWVRANIEEGIAAGIHKEVPIPRGSRWKESATLFDEDGFQYDDSSPSNSGTRLIGNVRLSPSERVCPDQPSAPAAHNRASCDPSGHDQVSCTDQPRPGYGS